MKLAPEADLAVLRALDVAKLNVDAARRGGETDAVKEAIRIARLNLINAYDAITEAEQAARAKYWTFIEQGEPA